jgi:hypothetical protein
MGQLTARNFGSHWIDATPEKVEKAGARWHSRVWAVIAARLAADTPPLAAAMAYSYAFRALPLPRD